MGGESAQAPSGVWQRLLVLAVVGVLLGAGSVTAVYVLTRKVSLRVTDGSTVGAIKGNLTSISSLQALVLYINATTYANQSDYPASTLTLKLKTWTYYDSSAQSVLTQIIVTLAGRLASNLRPEGFQLVYNQSGLFISAASDPGAQAGTNVTFNGQQGFMVQGAGEGALAGAVVRLGDSGQSYEFSYSDSITVNERPLHNHFLGLRANLVWPGAPIGVGILLRVVDTSGGTWP